MVGTGMTHQQRGTAPGGSRVPALTPGDQVALRKHGRPALIRRLRVQVAAGWTSMTATLVVGFPMLMSDSYTTQDTGLVLTMLSVPGMLVAAHGQARLTRLRGNDPSNSLRLEAAAPAVASAAESQELGQLAALRSRLLELVPAVREAYPDVAAAMVSADERAHRSLVQQAQALALLADSHDASTVAARDEIDQRLQAGIAEYQHLIAQAALLLARTDAHVNVDAPLRAAADLAVSYSEGITVSERSGDLPRG